jgi:outer membrane immunogenic protein
MKKFLLTTAALGLLAGPALAADLPVYKAPPAAPVCFWCGWYIGGNVGGTWAQDSNVTTAAAPVQAAGTGIFTFGPEAAVAAALASNNSGGKQSGFIGGGQIGYNLQLAPAWVAGFEADIQGLSNSNGGSAITVTSPVPGFPSEAFTSTTAVSKHVDYLGTVRGRFGVLLNSNTLLYGTGGLAYGGVHAATAITQTDTGILPGPVSANYTSAAAINTTRAGWTAGVGAEMRLWDRWTGKLEYLYYDLGSVSYGLPNLVANAPTFPAPTWTASAASSARFNGNIVRVGLNYKF